MLDLKNITRENLMNKFRPYFIRLFMGNFIIGRKILNYLIGKLLYGYYYARRSI